jgi:hypothetical protein
MSETWLPWISRRKYSPHRYKNGVQSRNGVLLHIAQGSYEGTISWQMNEKDPKATTSSEFIIGRQPGEVAQMMPLEDAAWAQRDGNRHWVAIEFAGFVNDGLTVWQIECAGRIYASLALIYGQDNYPLQITSDPTKRGLGWHGMGALHNYNWGHPDCPGVKVIAHRINIIDVARERITPTPTVKGITNMDDKTLAAMIRTQSMLGFYDALKTAAATTDADPNNGDTPTGRQLRGFLDALIHHAEATTPATPAAP